LLGYTHKNNGTNFFTILIFPLVKRFVKRNLQLKEILGQQYNASKTLLKREFWFSA
jgi:hypothetical protein